MVEEPAVGEPAVGEPAVGEPAVGLLRASCGALSGMSRPLLNRNVQ